MAVTKKPHTFEIARIGKYGENSVFCPVCRIVRSHTAMRIHIAKSVDQKHKDYYQKNTFEETIIRRVWKN